MSFRMEFILFDNYYANDVERNISEFTVCRYMNREDS